MHEKKKEFAIRFIQLNYCFDFCFFVFHASSVALGMKTSQPTNSFFSCIKKSTKMPKKVLFSHSITLGEKNKNKKHTRQTNDKKTMKKKGGF